MPVGGNPDSARGHDRSAFIYRCLRLSGVVHKDACSSIKESAVLVSAYIVVLWKLLDICLSTSLSQSPKVVLSPECDGVCEAMVSSMSTGNALKTGVIGDVRAVDKVRTALTLWRMLSIKRRPSG